MTMYPDAEEEIKIGTFKNVLSSLYEHVRTCKICHTYLNAILEHAVKSKDKQLPTLMSFVPAVTIKILRNLLISRTMSAPSASMNKQYYSFYPLSNDQITLKYYLLLSCKENFLLIGSLTGYGHFITKSSCDPAHTRRISYDLLPYFLLFIYLFRQQTQLRMEDA